MHWEKFLIYCSSDHSDEQLPPGWHKAEGRLFGLRLWSALKKHYPSFQFRGTGNESGVTADSDKDMTDN